MAAAASSSLYEVLGIPASATGNEIKAAYRRLARTCHPDVAATIQKEMPANEFLKIHAAYSTLSDPYKRANYDRDLSIMRKRNSPVASSSSSSSLSAAAMASMSRFTGNYYGTRNWETDQCW